MVELRTLRGDSAQQALVPNADGAGSEHSLESGTTTSVAPRQGAGDGNADGVAYNAKRNSSPLDTLKLVFVRPSPLVYSFVIFSYACYEVVAFFIQMLLVKFL